MKEFSMDTNGMIIRDADDAIFIPQTYLAGFKAALDVVGHPDMMDTTKYVGFLDLSYNDRGVYVADGHEGVFIGIADIPDLIGAMGL